MRFDQGRNPYATDTVRGMAYFEGGSQHDKTYPADETAPSQLFEASAVSGTPKEFYRRADPERTRTVSGVAHVVYVFEPGRAYGADR